MKQDLRKQIKILNAARSQYNPLRGITIQKVANLLEYGEHGEYKDLQWLYRMIEKRDAVLRALVRRRAAALLKLDWNIKQVPEDTLPEGSTQDHADAQALALRTLYDGIGNLKDAIKFLALAEFRGYSHLEKSFNEATSTDPEKIDALYPIKQWYWCRDGLEGDWMFDPELRGSYRSGEEVEPEGMIVREVDDPVNEIGLIAFLRKNMSQKDWDGFVEVFGIPDIFFTMPPGLSTEDQDAWLVTAERMAGDGRGALPFGAGVEAVGGDVRGTNPFKDHLEYQDTMMVLAGTGGKLTMLSDSTGIGGGATDAHEDAFNELAQAEAAEISELLRCCLDAPLLAAKFEGQPTLAYFEIAAKDEEDITALIDNALKLYQAGIEIDVADLAERTGYSLTRINKILKTGEPATEEEEEVEDSSKVKNRSIFSRLFNRDHKDPTAKLKQNSRGVIAQATAEDFQPLAAALADLLDNTSDDDLADALQDWRENELEDLTKQLLSDPAAATAWEDSLTAAQLNGFFGDAE